MKKNNTKTIIAILMAMVIISAVFAACKGGKEETANGTTKNTSDVSMQENTTNEVTESTTAESTTAETTTKNEQTKAQTVTTTAKSNTNQNKNTNKPTNKPTEKQTQKKAETTTKKITTTQKPTQKNVSPKDVQAQVNAYIKSKGVKVDSSMTPSNASWSGQIAGRQSDINEGYSLKTCKGYVDFNIDEYKNQNGMDSMYCYYSNDTFYVLYWPSVG